MGDNYEEPAGEPSKRKARPLVVQEGPIFLSTQAVQGSTILPQAKNNLVRRVRGGSLANAPTSKILFLSNTHGNEAGLSGITSKDCLKDYNDGDKPGKTSYGFYAMDCHHVGLRPDKPPLPTRFRDTSSCPDQWERGKLSRQWRWPRSCRANQTGETSRSS